MESSSINLRETIAFLLITYKGKRDYNLDSCAEALGGRLTPLEIKALEDIEIQNINIDHLKILVEFYGLSVGKFLILAETLQNKINKGEIKSNIGKAT